MAAIIIVGDGPGGLSAALLLAKNGHDTVVHGDDKTAMHFALLNNYLGAPGVPGSEFQSAALAQVEAMGARIDRRRVESIESTDEGFSVTLDDGATATADYLILAEGRSPSLGQGLGLDQRPEGGIAVDSEFRASMPRVYVVGRSARPRRSQAIISAGAGATAALDILADIAGEDVQDWDSMPKD
jgi:thioredoxin reductase